MESYLSYGLAQGLADHPYFVCSNGDSLFEKDVKNYWYRKRNGELKENHWVVIRNCELLIQTSIENEASDIVITQDGMSLLMLVGHENHVVEIDSVQL